jgi:hypothetical protein
VHLFSLLGLEELVQQKIGKMKKYFSFKLGKMKKHLKF